MLPHPTRADLTGTRPCWMLDLTWGGNVYRIASEPCAVTTPEGRTLSYCGGLDVPELVEELDVLGLGTDASTATIEVHLQGVDVAKRHRSHHLQRAEGSIYLGALEDGPHGGVPVLRQRSDRRWHQLTGYLRAPEFGDPQHAATWLRATVREAPWDSRAQLISKHDVLTTRAWSTIADELVGKVVPTVLGAPGSGGEAGSPAYVLVRDGFGNAVTLIVAAHPVVANNVTIIDEDGASESFSVDHVVDGTGLMRSRVSVSAAATINRAHTQFWVAWDDGGGLASPVGPGSMTSAAELLIWALQSSGLDADLGQWRAVVDRLPDVSAGTYINEPVEAWAWLEKHVFPLLPISVRRGPNGIHPLFLVPSDSADDRRPIRISAGPEGGGGWQQTGGVRVETDPADIVRTQVVRYAYDGRTGAPKGRFTWTVYPEIAGEEYGSLYTEGAFLSFGAAVEDAPLDLRLVWDSGSAGAVAAVRARLLGVPLETIEATADWSGGDLRLARECSVSASLAHYTDQAALVTRRVWDGRQWAYEWTVWPDVVRDRRPT